MRRAAARQEEMARAAVEVEQIGAEVREHLAARAAARQAADERDAARAAEVDDRDRRARMVAVQRARGAALRAAAANEEQAAAARAAEIDRRNAEAREWWERQAGARAEMDAAMDRMRNEAREWRDLSNEELAAVRDRLIARLAAVNAEQAAARAARRERRRAEEQAAVAAAAERVAAHAAALEHPRVRLRIFRERVEAIVRPAAAAAAPDAAQIAEWQAQRDANEQP